MTPAQPSQPWRRLLAVASYGIAMGVAEAICVVYLRQLILPAGATEIDVRSLDRYSIEVVREACTIVMLAAVGWLAGWDLASRFGFFVAAFGLWDIAYYVGLHLAAGWPQALLEWDCLFLIPCPWYGPVLAPIVISAIFVMNCVSILWAQSLGNPVRLSPVRLGLLTLGWSIWILSFTLPAIWEQADKYPSSYPWWALALGSIPSLACSLPGSWDRTSRQLTTNH